MYCSKCGTKNSDDGNYCVKCGNNLKGNVNIGYEEAVASSSECTALIVQPKGRISKRTKKIIGCVCVALALVVAIGAVVLKIVNRDKEFEEFKAMFNNKKYSEACNIYNKATTNITDDTDKKAEFRSEVSKYVIVKISDVKSDCKKQQENFDYNDARTFLGNAAAYVNNTSYNMNDIYQYLSQMQQSKEIYRNAMNEENNKQYMRAAEYYKKVIKDDSNYEKAQSKVKEMYAMLKQKSNNVNN